jgi:hypothetical protein
MDFNQLLLVAFLVESLIQTIKPVYDREKGWNKDALVALVMGIGICFLMRVDLFEIVGLSFNIGDAVVTHYVGTVLTGIIASRGSNLAHDALKFVQNASKPSGGVAVG